MGTGTFLFWQTLLVIIWITLNLVGGQLRWDPYPFILLNLAFSTQAAYAAPLILLAQNRQDDRDRITLDEDRNRAAQTKADTEFLARELAALRVAIGEVATRDYLRGELDRLRGRPGGDDQPGRRRRHDQTDPGQGQEPAKTTRKPPPAHQAKPVKVEPTGSVRTDCTSPAGPRRRPEHRDADRAAADRRITAATRTSTPAAAAALTELGIGSLDRCRGPAGRRPDRAPICR